MGWNSRKDFIPEQMGNFEQFITEHNKEWCDCCPRLQYKGPQDHTFSCDDTLTMANQDVVNEEQESRNTFENTERNETLELANVNRSRNESEDSVQPCGVGSMCGVDGVLCSSGNVLESMFPYLATKGSDNANLESPRGVRSIITGGSGATTLSPMSKPIRRGRFLVWPAVIDCSAPLTTCGPIAITPSTSSSSE